MPDLTQPEFNRAELGGGLRVEWDPLHERDLVIRDQVLVIYAYEDRYDIVVRCVLPPSVFTRLQERARLRRDARIDEEANP